MLATRAWPEGVDELLLSDDGGRPVGGSRSNLFWVRDGVLHTPSLERCGVAGLTRDKVLTAARTDGVPVRVVGAERHDLARADEVFMTSSLIGIWPVARLETSSWRAPGPVTRRLAALLRHPRVD